MPKVYIVNSSPPYEDMFKARGWELSTYPLGCDLIQFTGGADVSPHLYGEKTHEQTFTNPVRDGRETGLFTVALRDGIPMCGICRGGQLLNILSGGSLYQHCDGHATPRGHMAKDLLTGGVVEVTSTHHQIMRCGTRGEVLLEAVDTELTFAETYSERHTEPQEVEAVFYPHSKALCFQPHPEYLRKDSDCQELYFKYIEDYLGVK